MKLTGKIPVLYECGICNCLHPWEWDGDCRDDDNRFASVCEYKQRFPLAGIVRVRTMEERVEA